MVTNIFENTNQKIEINEFKNLILQYIEFKNPGSVIYSFSNNDILEINKLAKSKYLTWEWNYGYSPKFKIFAEIIYNNYNLKLIFEVEKGVIKKINSLKYENDDLVQLIDELLSGELFIKNNIMLKLDNKMLNQNFKKFNPMQLINQLF